VARPPHNPIWSAALGKALPADLHALPLAARLGVVVAGVAGATLFEVTTREKIDAVLNNMPESELEPVLEILISRVGKEHDPEAPQPDDIVDEWGNLSALRRASSARKLGRLDEAEIAEFGETLGESITRTEGERENEQ
jgi:hypothetical protein